MLITCPHCSRESEHATVLRAGDLVLELDSQWLRRDQITVRLSRLEATVITALMRAGDGGIRLNDLRPIVYRDRPSASANCISMAVMRSREKLRRLRADIPKNLGDGASYRYRIVVRP